MKLLINSTPLASWYDIIHEAECSCATNLPEDIESYLVFLLMRYSKKPEIANQIMAMDFLHSINLRSSGREVAFQEIGDRCLLFSGLFPAIAHKRLVSISYFIHLGQSAYQIISKNRDDLYSILARDFVSLMDILQSIHCGPSSTPELLPLQAYELWNETGSKRALSILKQYTQSTVIPISKKYPN